jgi:hypothetical protein
MSCRAGAFRPILRRTRSVMTDKNILDQVRVASPCNARWEDMAGDERARFCRQCRKHVFNLSALTRPEIEALIREKEGRFCGRFHQRRDGRMLTADCRVGRRMAQWRWVKVCGAVFAVATLMGTAALASIGPNGRSRSPFAQRMDGWIYDLKVRLGIIDPPAPTMGDICILPPPSTQPGNLPPVPPPTP